MEATFDPFAILDVEPGTSLEAVRASYRRLARLHHPDMVAEQDRERATKTMTLLNKAMAELERDFDGWTVHLTRWSQVAPTREPFSAVLSVEPRFMILSEANGFEAFVTVAASSGDGKGITLRYREGLIVAERLRVGGRGVANFRVRVSPKVRELGLPERVAVELVAPGHSTVLVTVAVEPFSAPAGEGLSATGRPASWWQRLRGAG